MESHMGKQYDRRKLFKPRRQSTEIEANAAVEWYYISARPLRQLVRARTSLAERQSAGGTKTATSAMPTDMVNEGAQPPQWLFCGNVDTVVQVKPFPRLCRGIIYGGGVQFVPYMIPVPS